MVTSRIERFTQAQDSGAQFETALAELTAGRKRGHWIWFVFPQLAGLGMSSMSQRYGVHGRAEAVEYLRHPVLAARLAAITKVVGTHVKAGVGLDTIMGSSIDATKLVSSLTLFGRVAGDLSGADGNPTLSELASSA